MNTYSKLRIALFTLAFGLASVPFCNTVYEKWAEIPVDLPKVESDSPLFITPYDRPNIKSYKPFSIEQLYEGKDLSLYESSGKFSNCAVPLSEYKQCKKNAAKARTFILNHWKAKKMAYIAYEWTGVDTGGDEYIFIEPDEKGQWHILMRSTRDYRYFTEIVEEKAYSIKRKKARTEDEYPFEIGSYYLILFNENGETVETF